MAEVLQSRYDLKRFLEAQEQVYEQALSELRAGRKHTHWMWFIFPQLAGLGRSEMARRYAIRSLEEACAYLEHPILGAHLRECASAAIGIEGKTAAQVFGYPDDLKFRSSMTLFAHAAPEDPLFRDALRKYFHAEDDALTLSLLKP